MLVGIFGALGRGKTLLLTVLTYIYRTSKDAFIGTNYVNQCADITLSAEELLIQLDTLDRKDTNMLALDELGRILDSTKWMSDINETLNKIFLTSRKIGFDIYYTSQSALMVDRNVRRITDIILIPEIDIKRNILTVVSYEQKMLQWLPSLDVIPNIDKYFSLYNTNEIIDCDKQAIISHYADRVLSDNDLLAKIISCNKRSDMIEVLVFHLTIKKPLAKQVLFEIDIKMQISSNI